MAFPHKTTYTPLEDLVTDVIAEDQLHHLIFGGDIRVTTLPTRITGPTTGSTSGTTLINSGATFVTNGISIGDIVYNDTDASYAIVKTVSSETQLITTPLKGGTTNMWTLGNTYSVRTAVDQRVLLTQADGSNQPGLYIRAVGNGSWTYIGTSGMSWNTSISGTSGTGFTTTVSNSASAGAIGQSIIIGNTQTAANIGLKIDLGTSAQGHTGLLVNAYNAS